MRLPGSFMRARIQYVSVLSVLAAIAALTHLTNVAWAAEGDGSLDSVWTDATKSASLESKALDAGDSTPAAAKQNAICPVETLLNSQIILTGGWPGVGPFKPSAGHPYEFSDKVDNRLELTVGSEQVTAAQMDITSLGSNLSEGLLKLQVSTDFLLEGLGVKPAKVHEFNLKFEKETARLKGVVSRPLKLASGPLLVYVSPLAPSTPANGEPAGNKANYRVRVTGSDSTAGQPVVSSDTMSAPEHTDNPPVGNASPNAIDSGGSQSDSPSGATTSNPPPVAFDQQEKPPVIGTSTAPVNVAGKTPGKATPSSAEQKQEFLQMIQNWQTVKKKALRQGDTGGLSEVLAGKALARQIDAIKWLVANHKYYEMNPKGALVERIVEAVPDKKYAVHAQVKESTKYVDQKNGQLLKETDDTYHVIYNFEKTNGHWFITDSTIVKPNPASPPAKVRR